MERIAVGLGAVVVGLSIVFLVRWVRGLRESAEREARCGRVPRLTDVMANSYGATSQGPLQIRGNGCLAAHDDVLVFVQWMPRRTLQVPRSAIRKVDTTSSHLGKSGRGQLLRVTWDRDGGSDEVAFSVRDLDAWLAELAAH